MSINISDLYPYIATKTSIKVSIMSMTKSQLIVIGHKVTCKSTLDQLIRVSHCPILVTHAPFLPPTTALFAFDNCVTYSPDARLVVQNSFDPRLTVHIVMVGKNNNDNCDALREAYARLKQAGINTKKALLDCRDVSAAQIIIKTSMILAC